MDCRDLMFSKTYNIKSTSRRSHPSLLSTIQARRRRWCLEVIGGDGLSGTMRWRAAHRRVVRLGRLQARWSLLEVNKDSNFTRDVNFNSLPQYYSGNYSVLGLHSMLSAER